MTSPSVILRSLKNEETGIDISVPGIQEEEAPLGGISVLYEISVLTKLALFKTRLHKSEDIVHFSIYKAYREIEELYNKLTKKYPKVAFPAVPKSNIADKLSNDEKMKAVNVFLDTISRNIEICTSSIFSQFIGVSPQKLHSLSIQKIDSSNNHDKEHECPSDPSNKVNSESKTLDEVFPKMKASASESHNKVSLPISNKLSNNDLFEEVKLVTKTNESTSVGPKDTQGLFDEFEDDSLFCSKPTQKAAPSSKPVEKRNEPKADSKKKEPSKPVITNENVDDSQIIIKDRKLADVSLFEEQDLGEYVTKDEEALFLVTTNMDKDSKKNTLLLFEGMPSSETDSSLNENLDDLLNLEPLPHSPTEKDSEKEVGKLKSDEVDSPVLETNTSKVKTVNEVDGTDEDLPSKPVPLPRKKSLAKTETETLMGEVQRPEVMPRKVFLNKPQIPSKPASSPPEVPAKPKPPPALHSKPAPPPKPKPPPKKPKPISHKTQDEEKILDIANANEPQEVTKNMNTDLTNDLHNLDILKYIEQEEKSLEAKPSLFD